VTLTLIVLSRFGCSVGIGGLRFFGGFGGACPPEQGHRGDREAGPLCVLA
jgi:hypothetical protein